MIRRDHFAAVSGLLLLTGAVFLFRLVRYRDLEPRPDQAHCARWVQDLRRSDHFWPRGEPGEGFRASLEGDQASEVHQLLRRIFNQGIRAFNLVSLAVLYTGSLLLGDSYRAAIVSSLLASCGTLLLIGLFPAWVDRAGEERLFRYGWGLAAAFTCASSFYLDLFSPWGWHNLGAFFTLLAAAVTSRAILRENSWPRGGTRVVPVVLAASLAAVYSHYTALFFVPAATAACLVLNPAIPWSARLRRSAAYVIGITAGMLPGLAAVFLIGRERVTAYATVEAGGLAYARGAAERAVSWFSSGERVFSAPGMVIGIAGLVMMARTRRITMPLGLVVMHLIAWILVPGFSATEASPTWLRTYVYILPLLCLGFGYTLAWALSGRLRGPATMAARTVTPVGSLLNTKGRIAVAAALVTVGLAAWHVAIQMPYLADPMRIARRIPSFADEYLEGQGRLDLFVQDLHGTLQGGAALLAWDFILQDLYACLAPRDGQPALILPSLDIMRERSRSGTLRSYLARRKLTLETDREVLLVARSDMSPSELLDAAAAALGPNGFGWRRVERLSPVRVWNTGVPIYGDIVLYHLSAARAQQGAGEPRAVAGRQAGS